MKHILNSLSLIALLVLFPLSLFGAIRTVDEAANIAVQYLNETSIGPNKAPMTAASLQLVHERAKLESAEPAFYIFNKTNEGGFVIVSGDDRTEDILGYSDKGAIDMERVNPNFRFWLNLLQEAVSATNDTNVIRKAPQETTVIGPLLVNKEGKEITWYQESPYYNLCPKDADGYRSLTGCVATSAAMVMCKWRYPVKGTGSHSYKWTNSNGQKKTLTVDYENTTYDWDNMLPAYMYKSATTAQKTAVATLMYHAGVACDMQYSSEGSGAFTDDMANGLVDYFGYLADKFITTYSSYYYPSSFPNSEYKVTIAQFTDYFNADLEEGRPIIMGGTDTRYNGGHEFVCDGRDEKGNFHINWGWEGDSNGFFSLDALKVDGYNFSSGLDAIIGLRPGVVDTIHVTSVEVSPQTLTLKMNEKQALSTTFVPEKATVKRVDWSSSDESVAKVSEMGLVRGVNTGTAFIVATTVDGGWQDTCVVTVTDEYLPSEDFELVTSASMLRAGDDVIIGATYSGKDYCVGNYMTGTSKTTYAQCEEVTIEEDVIILPQETDVAVFRLGIQDGAWTFTNKDGQKLSASGNKKLDLDQNVPTWFVDISETHADIASTKEAYGQIYYNNNNNDPRFCIYSSTTLAMKTPNLYVRYNSKPDNVVPVTGIAFEKEQDSVFVGQELSLAYTLEPCDATNTAIRWSSSDTSVVTFSQHQTPDTKHQTLYTKQKGEAVITARTLDGGYVASCQIKVVEDHTDLNQTPDAKHRSLVKVVENGRVIFIRDGVKYNVLGVKL